jgi:hypothetical protein
MSFDWKQLTPYQPLEPDAPEYVARPSGAGQVIADRILAGGSTILVGGPAGIGKSTELAHAAQLLQNERVVCFMPLDRWENMRRLTPRQLLLRIAGSVAFGAIETLRLELSEGLRQALCSLDVLDDKYRGKAPRIHVASTAATVASVTLEEVARLATQGRVTLLIDGMERVPAGAAALELFDALGKLPEAVELVVVIPWHAAFGAHAETMIRPGERLEMLRPPSVSWGEDGQNGRAFLLEVLDRRLGLAPFGTNPVPPETSRKVFEEAASWSEGLPRVFLQLVAEAGTYARLHRGADWPDATDLEDAIADQRDSFRRLLLPGDAAAIRDAEGTDGRELDLERKVRLLSHGLLLERLQDRRPRLEIHRLAKAVITEGQPHA